MQPTGVQESDKLVAPSRMLRPVNAHKRRVGYKVGGCTADAAVGTAGLRIARNSASVIAAIRAHTGVATAVDLSSSAGRPAPDVLVAMGGAVTNIAFTVLA